MPIFQIAIAKGILSEGQAGACIVTPARTFRTSCLPHQWLRPKLSEKTDSYSVVLKPVYLPREVRTKFFSGGNFLWQPTAKWTYAVIKLQRKIVQRIYKPVLPSVVLIEQRPPIL